MANNKGKVFEEKVKEDWKTTFPDSFILRLADQVSGYYGASSNPSDFIAFENKKLFLIECKSHEGNTFPFSAFRQYDKMLEYVGKPDVHCGLILWFIDHDKVLWVPMKECIKMKSDNCKSINIKMLQEKMYNIIEIPSKKLRTYMKCDFSILDKVDELE